jgi:hypothetical protein
LEAPPPVGRRSNPRHIDYWQSQACDVWLVIRYQDVIRWMNVSDYLRQRPDPASRQIVFDGEPLDAGAVWRLWDRYIERPSTVQEA